MLALCFHVGDARYAVRCAEIVEVVPRVLLREVPHAPAHVLGQFTYRGTVTPVIDLVRLMTGTDCAERLSSRIILARYRAGSDSRVLGLLAERVTEALDLDPASSMPTGIEIPEARYLGEIVYHERTMIQLVRVAEVLPSALREVLFPSDGSAPA